MPPRLRLQVTTARLQRGCVDTVVRLDTFHLQSLQQLLLNLPSGDGERLVKLEKHKVENIFHQSCLILLKFPIDLIHLLQCLNSWKVNAKLNMSKFNVFPVCHGEEWRETGVPPLFFNKSPGGEKRCSHTRTRVSPFHPPSFLPACN